MKKNGGDRLDIHDYMRKKKMKDLAEDQFCLWPIYGLQTGMRKFRPAYTKHKKTKKRWFHDFFPSPFMQSRTISSRKRCVELPRATRQHQEQLFLTKYPPLQGRRT